MSNYNEQNVNTWDELNNNDQSIVKDIPTQEPKWLANVGLILCIFSLVPGLVFAIIGLNKLSDKASRTKCIIGIVIFAVEFLISFLIGFLFAEEIMEFYMQLYSF